MEAFKQLGLTQKTLKALSKKGFTTPTQIQAQTIPLLLAGKKDILGQSQTGTGKTASFALPLIEKLDPKAKHVQAIVLAPTRELAVQVAKEIDSLQTDNALKTLAVYGGTSITEQFKALRQGVAIVVGTPGRVIDHIKRKSLDLSKISFVVLDEADEMLNMGFLEDIEYILSNAPKHKRMLLFSATMPQAVLRIAKRFMQDYDMVTVKKEQVTQQLTDQICYHVMARDRFEVLRRIIDMQPDFHGIVFCNRRSDVDQLTQKLVEANYQAAALHGDISQNQREKILLQFRKKNVTILVATDVAARGIDVNNLTHVVNYSLPQSVEAYVHRIGRTGRAGNKGVAITFVIPSERGKLRAVERVANTTLRKEDVPSVKDVIGFKRDHLLAELEKRLAKDQKGKQIQTIAQELLTNHAPLKVVSALLSYTFSTALSANNYKEIAQVTAKDYKKGRRDNKYSRDDRKRRSYKPKRDGERRFGRSKFKR